MRRRSTLGIRGVGKHPSPEDIALAEFVRNERRKAAEDMRERCAKFVMEWQERTTVDVDEDAIRALPLPGDKP